MTKPMRANLDSRRSQMRDFLTSQERLARILGIPRIIRTQSTRKYERGGVKSVALKYWQRVVSKVSVTIVERKPDEPISCTVPPGFEQLSNRCSPAATFAQPFHVLLKSFWVNGCVGWVYLVRSNGMIHQDSRLRVV